MQREWELEKAGLPDQGEARVSLADLAQLSSEGLALIDPVTGITVISNGPFQWLFGLTPGEAVCLVDLMVQEWARQGWAAILEAGPEQIWRPARLLLRRPGRQAFPAEVRIAWVERSAGHLLGVAIKDLSVEERMAGMVARGVRLRRLAGLAGSLVHRFNNLLGTITGFAATLQGDQASADRDRALGHIEEAGREAVALSQGLVRVTDAVDQERPQVFDLAEEMARLTDLMGKMADKRGVRLELSTEEAAAIHVRPDLFRDLVLDLSLQCLAVLERRGCLRIVCRVRPGRSEGGWERGRVALEWRLLTPNDLPRPQPALNQLWLSRFMSAALGGELEHREGDTEPVTLLLPQARAGRGGGPLRP